MVAGSGTKRDASDKPKSWGLSISPRLRGEVVEFAKARGVSFSAMMCMFAEHGMRCKAFEKEHGKGVDGR